MTISELATWGMIIWVMWELQPVLLALVATVAELWASFRREMQHLAELGEREVPSPNRD